MRDNFEACIEVSLRYEGGLSVLRSDPGNWTGGRVGRGQLKGTNFGIAASSHPSLDIVHLSRDEAKAIYRREYWDAVAGDDLPKGVDLCIDDYAINSGPSRAASTLQRCTLAPVTGKVDAATLRAVAATAPVAVIKGACDSRLSFLEGLSSWREFGKGWAARVGDLRARALAMAANIMVARQDAGEVDAKAEAAGKRAKAATAAAGTTGAAAAADHAGGLPAELAWPFTFLAVAILAGAAIYWFRHHAHKQAARAAEGAIAEMTAASTAKGV